jgi:minor extracellular serine protease Vpr
MKILSIAKSTAVILLIVNLAFPVSAMDLARAETRTDLAVSTFGVTGQGVIVAIIDRGIDWRNNDFRNADGSTRIKFIFDMTDNTGANHPDNPYGVGTIYTEGQINAANAGGTALVTRDAVGHGTTTAGIAAGNGRNHATAKYRGIAPNASIIAVKFTTEGAPAHDGQPAEAPFYNPDLLPKAIDFVRDKAAILNMPAVMLANFGSIGGPTDGTSFISRTIDARFGAGKPGLVFVSGPGDEGGMPNHAGGNVTQGQTTSIQLQKTVAGTMILDLWYPGADRFSVSVQTPSGTTATFAGPATNTTSTSNAANGVTIFHQGSSVPFYGAQNGKREIFMQITGTGNFTINLTGTSVTAGGRFDAGINPSTIHTNNRFLTHVVPGNIWDGATAFNNISPGDYVVRTNWTDIDGVPRSNTGQGAVGNIWTGSSAGPTYDGRMGVDMTAPGDSVFTTLNPTSNFAPYRFNHIQDGNGFYTRASAVSAAAPQVTGLIALMLQKNRNLDAIQVRDILRRSSRKDSFTGPDASTTWGHGKMDSLNAITIVAAGFEGDVAPRPNGDNSMLSTDITQLRRFVSGLDTPNGATNEVQRIDCAPRSTSGDGVINSSDVVQGRRYVSGLDPTTLSGGPAARPSVTESVMSTIERAYSYFFFAREVKVGEAIADRSTATVPIEINPDGDEVAISFTLEYDATRFSNPRVLLGEAVAEDSTLTVNANEKGRIGILIDSTEPMAASVMAKQLLTVTFDVIGEGQSKTAMSITGSLAELGVSDALGNLLAARYVDGKIVLHR